MSVMATVLRGSLPVDGYEIAPDSLVAQDVQAHARALEDAMLRAERLLETASGTPAELIPEFERALGLPRACALTVGQSTQAQRLSAINQARARHWFGTDSGLRELFGSFGMTIVRIQRFRPLQCTATCTSAVDVERSRFKVRVFVRKPITADVSCLAQHYLPVAWRFDVVGVD